MDENGKSDEILIQITCKYSIENQRNGYYDVLNDGKQENFHNQLLYKEDDSADKIFNETVEQMNLAKLYLNGYDITFVKYGQKNVFFESEDDEPSDKTDESTTSEDSDDSESEAGFSGGIVQKFIRTIFEELVSAKDLNFYFSIGWTEINEQNQLLDLLNGNGLVQCFAMSQLLEMLALGLSNRSNTVNHNILSIVLEQQWMHEGQPQLKLSTANFCDLIYGTDKAIVNNFIGGDPREQVPMNFYSQPVPQLPPYAYMMPPMNGSYFSPPPAPPEFGFFNANPIRPNLYASPMVAQQQSSKLLKNAEILFSKLNLSEVNEQQRKEIQEWMYLKAECDNFLPSSDVAPELPPSYFGNVASPPVQQPVIPPQPTSLGPIPEMDETNDDLDEDETNENDSDCGSYIDINDASNNLFSKISDRMTSFREKTDDTVLHKTDEYFQNNPKVLSSGQSDARHVEQLDEAAGGVDLKMSSNSMNEEQYLAKSGRRRSIRDTNILNSDELDLIRKAAATSSFDLVKEQPAENENQTKLDEMRRMLKKSLALIETTKNEIREVEETIALKKQLLTDLVKNTSTRKVAKTKCNKKKAKYISQHAKATKQLEQAIQSRKAEKEIQRLEDLTKRYEAKISDVTGIDKIAAESAIAKNIEQLHKSLGQSKKDLESLHKKLKKEVKEKESLEKDIQKQAKLVEGETNDGSNKKLVPASPAPSSVSKNSDKVKIRDFDARISHLKEVLEEKSTNLQHLEVTGDDKEKDKEREGALRCEINNLRRTRKVLLEQRLALDKKLKRDKMLSYDEERSMFTYEEAINAIDDAIEAKNERICGHKSIDTDEKLEREKGLQLLMARLNNLPEEEMRVQLYKYFLKVVDMKQSCKKLEQTLQLFDRERETWEWHQKMYKNAIRQLKHENEQKLIIQERNHEARLNTFLRFIGNQTANSSMTDSNFDASSTSGAVALPDYDELNLMKAATKSHHQYHQQHSQMQHHTGMDREIKKNLVTKTMNFTSRIYQHPSGPRDVDNRLSMIPPEKLKQLAEKKPEIMVTREKKKLIIQKKSDRK